MERSATFSRVFFTAIGLGVFSALGFAALSHAAPPAVSARAKQGDVLFHKHCIVCHNKEAGNTSPFGPPNLHGIFRPDSPLKLTPPQAVGIITHGRGNMPAFGKTLSKSEINSVIAYLKTQ